MVLRPKGKLLPKEREAAEARRKDIINAMMKEWRQVNEIQWLRHSGRRRTTTLCPT